ncbi:MAG TPA: hypothetical protein VMH81_22510 [Bryobacteraceae bacterium]|nr:hypothetical protein [Bryobacteraceae bacterium]
MASPRLTGPALRVDHVGCRHAAEAGSDAIREQLDRILTSPVFRNSRRNSSLLRHVVERALEGRTEELKERNIGIDVFSRAADYDTNSDHVVRSVAGEVRRRLAQYYMEPGRESEARIDLVAGSYVPQFRLPPEKHSLAPTAPALPVTEALRLAHTGDAPPDRLRKRFLPIAVVASLVLGLGSFLAVRFAAAANAVDQFWNPFFSSSSPALLCFGGGGQTNPASEENLALSISEFEHLSFRRMHTLDAVALADVAGLLQANRKPYRIVNRASFTSFRELQSGPFVLIGGMNNEWTLRLTSGMRFSFERQPNGARVTDKENPGNTAWSVDFTTPVARFNRDYAIVSRVRDPKTEQTVVIVAGIGSWGTLAAGEFVSRPEHLQKLEKLAPRHWEQKNLQVVLATDVIRGSSGPPIVLTAQFW